MPGDQHALNTLGRSAPRKCGWWVENTGAEALGGCLKEAVLLSDEERAADGAAGPGAGGREIFVQGVLASKCWKRINGWRRPAKTGDIIWNQTDS